MKNPAWNVVYASVALSIAVGGSAASLHAQAAPAKITVTSTAFADNATMPDQYTVDGKDAMKGHVVGEGDLVGVWEKFAAPGDAPAAPAAPK